MRLTATSWLVALAACLPAQRPAGDACLTDATQAFEVGKDSLLAGTWRLRLVTVGTRPTRQVSGTITLRRYAAPYTVAEPVFRRLPDSMSRSGFAGFDFDSVVSWGPTGARRRIYGWTDLQLADAGAPTNGRALTSRRPGAPGVLLEGVALRLGPPPLGFYQDDGFGTELTVERVGPAAFAGRWEASGFVGTWPSGTFCAERLKAPAT